MPLISSRTDTVCEGALACESTDSSGLGTDAVASKSCVTCFVSVVRLAVSSAVLYLLWRGSVLIQSDNLARC